MRKDREQANILRQSGMSYSEIVSEMKVPRSTLSTWFSKQGWSKGLALDNIARAKNGSAMRLMVLNTIRGSRLKKVYEDARQDAFADFEELKYHPLFIAGVMTYWAHGDKSSKQRISLSSSDYRVVMMVKLFLEHICGVGKIKARLILRIAPNDAQGEAEIKSFWISKTGLKPEQFGKSSFVKSVNGQKSISKASNVALKQGICNISLTSAYLKNKILRWIELMSTEILEEKYIDNKAGIV